MTLIEEPDQAQVPDPEQPEVSEQPEEPRRYPSTIGGALYLCVLAVMGLSLVLIATADDWRIGVRVLASAVAGAAVFRLVLPQKDAGMLAVRRRTIDVVLAGAVSVALFVLVASIPDESL